MFDDIVEFKLNGKLYKTVFFNYGTKALCLSDYNNSNIIYYFCLNVFSEYYQKEYLVGLNGHNIPNIEYLGVVSWNDLSNTDFIEDVYYGQDDSNQKIKMAKKKGIRVYKSNYYLVDNEIIPNKISENSKNKLLALLNTSIRVNNYKYFLRKFKQLYSIYYPDLLNSLESIYESYSKLYNDNIKYIQEKYIDYLNPKHVIYDGPKAYNKKDLDINLINKKITLSINIGFDLYGELYLMDILS